MSADRDTPAWTKPDEHRDAFDPADPIPDWEADWIAREIDSSIMTPEEFLRQTALKSNGKAGEDAALYWFRRHGWQMFKTEPPVKNCGPVPGRPGMFKAVYTDGGMPDFMGFVKAPATAAHSHLVANHFRACEVKEATAAEGDRVPHSRLPLSQRQFMTALPTGTAFVGILWRDDTFEVFPFSDERGSYEKGAGTI